MITPVDIFGKPYFSDILHKKSVKLFNNIFKIVIDLNFPKMYN